MKLAAVVLLLAPFAFSQPKVTLTGGPPVRAGQVGTVTVTATLSGFNGSGAVAFQFGFGLPAGLTVTSSAAGAALTAAGKTLTCAKAAPGTSYGCVASGLNTNLINDGVAGVFQISVSQITPASSLVQLNLMGVNAAGDTPPLVVVAGLPLPIVLNTCDVNGDGVIDTRDVQNVIDQINGVILPATTDLDGDGKTTVVDMQRVSNAISGGCRVGGGA